MLSKIVSLTIANNFMLFYYHCFIVVICFQKLYLWLSRTTNADIQQIFQLLWFAFKNCIFDYREQPNGGTANSPVVVICFQKLYLWLSRTTRKNLSSLTVWLWFAFKNCIFDYREQPLHKVILMTLCCDLLSKIVSLTIANNSFCCDKYNCIVVICFQKLYLWLSRTTVLQPHSLLMLLWFAFKNCIFDYREQHN